jgi:hypothetical protein
MGTTHFDYVKQWWASRFEGNVLLLHYSDAVSDPKTHIRRLAAFFGVNCTPAEIDRIAHLTSLESMKRDSLRFSCVTLVLALLGTHVARLGSLRTIGYTYLHLYFDLRVA